MAALTLRLVKGSPLTNAELDANFSALNTELGQKLVSSDLSPYLTSATAASTYQPTLVSGTSIKTINGTSLLGSGDVTITAGVSSFNTRTGAITLSSGDVTGALGFTPYDSTNPNSYITQSGARSAISVSGSLSYNSSTGVISYTQPTNVSTFNNDAGYLTGITGTQVTTALGYTPYNSTNPSGYVDQAGARSAISVSGSLSYSSSTGVISYSTPNSDGITEGSTNLYFTDARARGAISVTQNLTYNSSTGVITGPDLSGYLTSATAASTYQTQSGMSSYLTTSSAASTYLPLAGGTLTGNLAFSGTGLKIEGDFSGAVTSRLFVQTSTANGQTLFSVMPNGTAVNSQFQAYNSSDPSNSSIAALVASSSQVRIVSGFIGTGTLNPITFIFSNTEAARFDPTTRNFLINTSTDNGTDKLQVNGSVSATSITSTSASGIRTIQAATQDGVQLLGRAGGTGSYLVTLTPTTLTASRTVTLPDAAGTVVLDTATQTLTNKTIDGASNTLTNVSLSASVTGTLPIANGGTGQTSASAAFNALSPITTAGDLIIGNGSNSATRLPIGANNTVLKSNGTTASWQTVSAGGAIVSATAPASPSDGDLWYNTNDGTLYTRYSNTWVDNSSYSNMLPSEVSLEGGDAAGSLITLILDNGSAAVSNYPLQSVFDNGLSGTVGYENSVDGGVSTTPFDPLGSAIDCGIAV